MVLNFHCSHFQTWCTRAFDILEIGNLINITHIDENSEIVCFLGHYLHFTFFAVKKKKTAGKDAKAGKLVACRTRGPDGKIRTAGARAISQSDSRI